MESSYYPSDEKGSDDAAIPEDTLFKLLSSGRRRALLRALDDADGEAKLSDLTEAVAEAEGIDSDGPPEEYKKVYVSLYQTHVPSLAEAGAVEYDNETKVVRLSDRAGPLLRYLNFDPERERRGRLSRFFREELPSPVG